MDKLKVILDWFPNTNHTGYLLAWKRGWFKDAGLDVDISGEVHGTMELHGADFVCGPEIAMLECRERGIDLTGIAVMTQKCDSGIVSLKEAGITRPRDLEGKRLTHWTPAWFHAAIRRIVEEDGGDYDKIHLVNMDVGDILDTLGHVADATWVYENWENQVLLEAGKEINYFNLGDVDPVRRFLKVLDRAYREVAAYPEETVMEVRDMLPADATESLLIRSQKHLAPILLDKEGRWGRIDALRWDRMADFLVECGVISKRTEREYTNEYFEE